MKKVKRVVKHYIWFWKESFKYMQGNNKIKIAFQCMYKSIWFCNEMEKEYNC